MLGFIKAYTPQPLRSWSREVREFVVERQEARMTPRDAFTRIYLEDRWDDGQKAALQTRFYSGPGSADEFGRPYASIVRDFINENSVETVVDLGCGDFRVGSLIASPAIFYVGCDVVEPLIENHKQLHASERIAFKCLDIIADQLPDGDLCLVRQVFQHLSNEQVGTILGKLRKYKWVIVTEDRPGPLGTFLPNLDKGHGTGSRIIKNSGVVFEAAPFNLPNVRTLLDIPAPDVTRQKFSMHARLVTSLLWP